MKKWSLFLFLIILFSATNLISAQTANPKIVITKAERYIVSSPDNFLTLEADIVLTAGELNISKADKIIWNKEMNKIIVFGACEYSFNGKVVIEPARDGKYTILEYIIGEDTAYMK